MMKTALDAVITFKGEWPKSLGDRHGWNFGNSGFTINYSDAPVCDKSQFEKAKEKNEYGVPCFDLMFYGCQTINSPQAMEILKAIKDGKVHGVSFDPYA